MKDRDEEIQAWLDEEVDVEQAHFESSTLNAYQQLYRHLGQGAGAPVGFSERGMTLIISAKLARAEREIYRAGIATCALFIFIASLGTFGLVQMGWLSGAIFASWIEVVTRLPSGQLSVLLLSIVCVSLVDNLLADHKAASLPDQST